MTQSVELGAALLPLPADPAVLAPPGPCLERSEPSRAGGAPQPLELGVFERHPDGVLRLRGVRTEGDAPDFLCTYANPAAASLLGHGAPIGAALSRLLPGSAQGAIRAALAETLRSGEPYQGELPLLPPGSRVQVTALKDGDGALLFVRPCAQAGGALAPHDDGTERKQLENRLRESEERFQLFMRHCPAAAYIKDTDGRFVWVNANLERIHERSLGEWVGRTDADLFSADEAARVRANDRAVLEGQAVVRFIEPITIDGERQEFLSYKFPIRGEHGRPLLGGISVNITDQIRARDQVRRLSAEAEQRALRLETLFNTNLIGTITWRLDGPLTSANDAFLASVGYTREDLAAGRLSWRALTAPEYIEADRRKLAELAAHRAHTPYEKEYLHKDGTRVPVLVSAALFPDSDDEGIAYIVDLSEVKRAERCIRELLEQVSTASQAKDDFLATLAHELRNPLAPIRNAVQILKAERSQDPKIAWCQDVIDRQIRHMARLLEDLLDVSRIARAKLELRREPVEISSVIDMALETSRPLLDTGQHRLSVELPDGAVWVDGDPARLAQIFANLLNNAAKYTPDEGLISLTVKPEGSEVVVRVRDNGIGLAREMLPRVFEIFAQAGPALRRAQGGLGIGLSLVRGLVELHGGTVTAHSDGPNLGCEFTVRLPTVAARGAAGPDSASPLRRLRKRVLVVDDNVDGADSLAAFLEILGSEVRTAYDGPAALQAVADFRPAIVLLDIGMPGMSGHEVCRKLREQPDGSRLVLIALTGWGQAEDRRRTREAGFDRHLVKPVDVTVLAQLLAELST